MSYRRLFLERESATGSPDQPSTYLLFIDLLNTRRPRTGKTNLGLEISLLYYNLKLLKENYTDLPLSQEKNHIHPLYHALLKTSSPTTNMQITQLLQYTPRVHVLNIITKGNTYYIFLKPTSFCDSSNLFPTPKIGLESVHTIGARFGVNFLHFIFRNFQPVPLPICKLTPSPMYEI